MPPVGLREYNTDATLVLGPAVIAILLNVLLGGVCFLQVIHYFSGKFGDTWPVFALVCWVAVINVADTVCAGNLMWYYTVDTYVDNTYALLAPWQYHATAISSSMISLPVQHFLAWRMYQFSQSKALFALVSAMSITQGVLMIFVSASFIEEGESDAERLMPIFVVSYVAALANEILITSNLLYHFYKHRTGMKNTDLVMSQLSRIVMETAIPVTLCSILAGVSVLAIPRSNVFLIFTMAMGRLYTNTLLTTLNARRNIRTQLMSDVDSFNRFHLTESAHFEFRRPDTVASRMSHYRHDRQLSVTSDADATLTTPRSADFLFPHKEYIESVCDESLTPRIAAQRHTRSKTTVI